MKLKSIIVIMFSAVLLLAFSGCKTARVNTEKESIVGTWKDSYNLTEYKFEPNGKMKLTALDIGSFKGTYSINENKITIEYKILVKEVKDTYTFRINGDKLYLDEKEFTRKI